MLTIAKYASFITVANKLLNNVPVSEDDLRDGRAEYEINDILDSAKSDLEEDAFQFCHTSKVNGVLDLGMRSIIRELNSMFCQIKKYVPGYENIETADLTEMNELVDSHTLKNY